MPGFTWNAGFLRRLIVCVGLLAYLWNVISRRPSTVPMQATAKYAPPAMAESTDEKVHNCKL